MWTAKNKLAVPDTLKAFGERTLHSGGRRMFGRHYTTPTECTEAVKRMRASPWRPSRKFKSIFY
jgi:hypothetical protein